MKNVAAIVTEYRKWSHADVIVTKILEGFNQDGGPGPNLRLLSDTLCRAAGSKTRQQSLTSS